MHYLGVVCYDNDGGILYLCAWHCELSILTGAFGNAACDALGFIMAAFAFTTCVIKVAFSIC